MAFGTGRLTGIAHLSGGTSIASFSYTPDAAGNPLSVAEVMPLMPGGTTSYSYDSLNRLRTVNYPDGSWASYTFDPMGNRTQLTDGGGTTTYAYDRSDRLVSTSGQQALSFSWDPRGNQTGKGTHTFAYDQANRLASSNTGTTATYSYNGEGVRTGKTVEGVSTTYLQDVVGGLPHVLIESVGGQESLYVYGQGLAFEVKPDGSHRYYHSDALGSTRVVTDDAGTVVSAFNYDAYGSVRQSAGEGKSFTFTGEQTDESGLEFLRARYYDPGTGRFLSRDSIVADTSSYQVLNRYTYVESNPLTGVDPSGHWVETAWDAVNVGIDYYEFQKDPSLANGAALVVDAAAAVLPLVPAGAGLVVRGGKVASTAIKAVQLPLPETLSTELRAGTVYIKGIDDIVNGERIRRIPGPISDKAAKNALRDEARRIYDVVNPGRREAEDLQIHHRIPLEWAHLLENADPNRFSNLVGLSSPVHTAITARWNTWRGTLGRTPTLSEVMQFARQIDADFGRYYR